MEGKPVRRSRRFRGQSMVEFAIVAPIAVAMILLLIDFSRLVYTYAAISWASREGARLVSLAPNINTDCPALRRVEQVAHLDRPGVRPFHRPERPPDPRREQHGLGSARHVERGRGVVGHERPDLEGGRRKHRRQVGVVLQQIAFA